MGNDEKEVNVFLVYCAAHIGTKMNNGNVHDNIKNTFSLTRIVRLYFVNDTKQMLMYFNYTFPLKMYFR